MACRKVWERTYCKDQLPRGYWASCRTRACALDLAAPILECFALLLLLEMGFQTTPEGGRQERYVPLASRAMAWPTSQQCMMEHGMA